LRRAFASSLFASSMRKLSRMNRQTRSDSSWVEVITRAPQRSVKWWTGSGYLSDFRMIFCAKLERDFALTWTIAFGARVAHASSSTRRRESA
jgi:hypothetical protein